MSRDGPAGGGYGPTLPWWYANTFYFVLGYIIHSLYCPLAYVRTLDPEDYRRHSIWMSLVALRNFSITVSFRNTPIITHHVIMT